jgi:hypothetical protein
MGKPNLSIRSVIARAVPISRPMKYAFGVIHSAPLDVVSQEVVHPIQTEEAEVAKLPCSTEDRMDVQ